MRHILAIGVAAVLAACSAPEQPDYWSATRTGYGTQTAAQASAAGTPDYRTAALAEAGQFTTAMRPGLHKTRTGAPWLVAHSARYQAGGSPASGRAAAQTAMGYMSSKRKSPYAAQTHLGKSRARFRIVTVDGSSFAVLFKISLQLKYLVVSDKEALKQLYSHVAELSGCQVTGNALIKRQDGVAVQLAVPVACS